VKRKHLWIPLAALLLPVLARTLWFYPGFSLRPEVPTPAYENLSLPRPPLAVPGAEGRPESSGGLVIIDAAHGNQFQPGDLQSLTDLLAGAGARVEFSDGYLSLAEHLKAASAYLVVSPMYRFNADEVALVQRFVERGGRLLVFADATRSLWDYNFFTGSFTILSDASAANSLLAPFGLAFNNDYLYNLTENEGNYRNLLIRDFSEHLLTSGLTQVAFYGARSLKTETGQVLLNPGPGTKSSLTDLGGELAAAALSADGGVLAVGDFTFLSPPYHQVADNGLFAVRLAEFLLAGQRARDLEDFPYLFAGPVVQVLPAEPVQLTSHLFSAIGFTQQAFQRVNLSLRLADSPPAGGDLLVLGTFASAEELAVYLEPFQVEFSLSGGYAELPGFGRVGLSGSGLLFFTRGGNGNHLVLLAGSSGELADLLNYLNYAGVSSCLLQVNLGLCSIGFGGDFHVPPPDLESPPEIPEDEAPG
jgi:hypothetical protein